MTYHWTIFAFLLIVSGTLPPAAVWHWMTTQDQSRRETFFGARVELDFPESKAGRAILSQFRRRIWGWSLGITAASLLIHSYAEPGHGLSDLIFIVGPPISTIACQVAFGLAHGRTQREAVATTEPSVRVASFITNNKPDNLWLDWLTMLLPPLIPAVTLVFLASHWNQFPSHSAASNSIASACIGFVCGLFCTTNQWALLFRTRSSDWASTPSASHRYRTYLGMVQASVLTFISCSLCLLSVEPLHGTVAWLSRLNMTAYLHIYCVAWVISTIFAWSLYVWLRKHLDRESSDPMADKYWKWGRCYFNPNDSAIVVPTRSGVMQSLNYARPSVWVVYGVPIVLMIALQIVYAGQANDSGLANYDEIYKSMYGTYIYMVHAASMNDSQEYSASSAVFQLNLSALNAEIEKLRTNGDPAIEPRRQQLSELHSCLNEAADFQKSVHDQYLEAHGLRIQSIVPKAVDDCMKETKYPLSFDAMVRWDEDSNKLFRTYEAMIHAASRDDSQKYAENYAAFQPSIAALNVDLETIQPNRSMGTDQRRLFLSQVYGCLNEVATFQISTHNEHLKTLRADIALTPPQAINDCVKNWPKQFVW
jgi:hypothetical protein